MSHNTSGSSYDTVATWLWSLGVGSAFEAFAGALPFVVRFVFAVAVAVASHFTIKFLTPPYDAWVKRRANAKQREEDGRRGT